MNGKERLERFLRGESVDRKPNLTIVGSVITQYNGMDMETYCKDYKKMTEAAVMCARDVKLDYVQIASDLLREAEGFGSRLNFYPDRLPDVAEYALDDITEVERLKPLKAREVPRMWDIVQATKLALEMETEIYPMTAVVGPVTIGANVRGVENFMVDMYDEPEACEALLEIAAETVCDFVDELACVGAKYVYMPDPVASLLSPTAYQEFVLKYHKLIFSRMQEHGITGRLHMCGNTSAVLPYSSLSGAQIIDIDHAVDYQNAVELVQGRCILNGNIDPVADVFSCSAEHTYESIMSLGRKLNRPDCMFMPGCELPTATDIRNIQAIGAALEALGRS